MSAEKRRRPTTLLTLAIAAVAMIGTVGGGYALDSALATDEPEPLGPGVVTVEIDMRHSLFEPDELRVYEGTLVRFVVRNGDPIPHELVVGGEDVHDRHAEGQHALHPPVPGEVSVRPDQTGITAYQFDEPGEVLVACHLPGHAEYGMTGTVTVVPVD